MDNDISVDAGLDAIDAINAISANRQETKEQINQLWLQITLLTSSVMFWITS